nr:hypothetical protein [Tanacetum cinerariifolium]
MVNFIKLRKILFQCRNSLVESFSSARIKVVVDLVVGVGVGVDTCGKGVGVDCGIGRGMVVLAVIEVSGITVTGMVRKDSP